MEDKENAKINIHFHTMNELVRDAVKYEDFRQKRNLHVQNFRARKKKAEEQAKNARVLRPIPRQTHDDNIVSHVLEEISTLSIAERKVAVQSKFRTIALYDINKSHTSYIIQMEHNNRSIDWLKVVKPSVDKKGFGLFAMQNISQYKLVTLYLGDLFTTEHEKNQAVGHEKYTLLSHVTHSDKKGWSQNKKKAMYVVPKLKKKTWKDKVDEIYIGGHLVNQFQGTHKKTANVAFSYYFQIYSVQNIKAGDELLINYNNRNNIGNLKK